MPVFLNTRGKASIAIAICDRCRSKVPYSDLRPDGDSPGLMVCRSRGCWDRKDPYKLPARQPERIDLKHPRPDRRIGSLVVHFVDEVGSMLMTEDQDTYLIFEEQEDI